MNPLPELVQLLPPGLWSVVGLSTLAFSWVVHDALGKPLNRRQLGRLLRRRRYAVLYHELLQDGLARIDRWLTPAIGPSPEAREAEGRRAWSWPLFDFSLRLAVVYPLLTLVVAWAVLGTDGKLGSLVVLHAAPWSVRIGAFVWSALICELVYQYFRTKALTRRYWTAAYVVLSIAGAVAAFAVSGDAAFAAATAFSVVVFLSVADAFAFAGVGAGAGAGVRLGGDRVGVTFPRAVAGALFGAIAVAAAFAFAFPGRFAGAIVFAGAAFGALAFAKAVEAAARRTRFGRLAYAGLVVLLLVTLALAVGLSPAIRPDGATLIVFLGLLPLLNAIFDFLSIGLTRSLLRRGVVSPGFGAIGWVLWDVVSALGFFALLGLALVSMVHWLNGLGLAPLLDLAGLFADIRNDPGAYWWLYVTIFSTLLPTLLHLVLASFSALLAVMPEGVARFVRRQLPRIEKDAVAKHLAFWPLTAIGFLAIAAVAFGLFGLVTVVLSVFPYLGDWYLHWFERYAAWLGAPVVPVRPGWL